MLDELREAGYGAATFPMGRSGPSRSLRSIVTDLRSRHCAVPIASQAWLTMLASGGFEDRAVLGDDDPYHERDRDAPRDRWQGYGYGSNEAEEEDEDGDTEEGWAVSRRPLTAAKQLRSHIGTYCMRYEEALP